VPRPELGRVLGARRHREHGRLVRLAPLLPLRFPPPFTLSYDVADLLLPRSRRLLLPFPSLATPPSSPTALVVLAAPSLAPSSLASTLSPLHSDITWVRLISLSHFQPPCLTLPSARSNSSKPLSASTLPSLPLSLTDTRSSYPDTPFTTSPIRSSFRNRCLPSQTRPSSPRLAPARTRTPSSSRRSKSARHLSRPTRPFTLSSFAAVVDRQHVPFFVASRSCSHERHLSTAPREQFESSSRTWLCSAR